jgi:hypothetical protein
LEGERLIKTNGDKRPIPAESLAGGTVGAAFAGVGAAPGALIGGLLGGVGGAIGGSKLADYFTGAGKKSSKPSVTETKPGAPAVKPTVASVEAQTKPTVTAINNMGQKQVEAQKIAAEKAKATLTESQYNSKLQIEMIALLAVNAQYLNQITENTATETTPEVRLNGKKLATGLLASARRNFGINRTT